MSRQIYSFPPEPRNKQIQITFFAPLYLKRDVEKFLDNPFSPFDSKQAFYCDSIAYSLEGFKGHGISAITHRKQLVQQLADEQDDAKNQAQIKSAAELLILQGEYEKALVLIDGLEAETQVELRKRLGGQIIQPKLLIVENNDAGA